MKPISFNKADIFSRPPLFWWVIYFLVLLSIGIFVRDTAEPVGLAFTLPDIAQGRYGLGDPKYFAQAALDIVHDGWISPESTFIFNLWPPGFSLLEAGLVRLFGEEAPLVFILLALSAGLCALLLVFLRTFLLQFAPPHWATALPLSVMCFPAFRLVLLEPMGLILGEAFAIESFLLGLFLFLFALQKKSLRLAFFAGCMLALAAYFRSQFELLLLALSATAVPMFIWYGWKVFKQSDISTKKELLFPIWAMLVLLLVAHALTAPWRYYHLVNQKTISWVATSQLVYRNGLKTDEILYAAHGGFVVEGGGNLACKLEPSYCNSNDLSLFKRAFFDHALEWGWTKLSISGNYWFSPVSNWSRVGNTNFGIGDWVANWIFLLCVLSILPLLILTRSAPTWPTLLWFNLTVFGAFLVVFTLVHFEVRYFYFIKLYSYLQFVILSCIFLNIIKLRKVHP